MFNETSMYVSLKLSDSPDRAETEKELLNNSISIMPYRHENNVFALSFSGISENKIEDGIKIISKILIK